MRSLGEVHVDIGADFDDDQKVNVSEIFKNKII